MRICLHFITFLVLFQQSVGSNGNNRYCDFNVNHILCNATGVSGINEEKVSNFFPKNDKERRGILNIFNSYRRSIASGSFRKGSSLLPKAADLMQLEWCSECEKAALNLLKDCAFDVFKFRCCDCTNTGSFYVSYFAYTSKNNFLMDLGKMLRVVVSDKKAFDTKCLKNMTWECLTNNWGFVIVSSSRASSVGCAYTECFLRGEKHVILCFFGLSLSDLLNRPLYLRGEPCSACRVNSKCTLGSDNLCECKEPDLCQKKSTPLGKFCEKKPSAKTNSNQTKPPIQGRIRLFRRRHKPQAPWFQPNPNQGGAWGGRNPVGDVSGGANQKSGGGLIKTTVGGVATGIATGVAVESIMGAIRKEGNPPQMQNASLHLDKKLHQNQQVQMDQINQAVVKENIEVPKIVEASVVNESAVKLVVKENIEIPIVVETDVVKLPVQKLALDRHKEIGENEEENGIKTSAANPDFRIFTTGINFHCLQLVFLVVDIMFMLFGY